MAIPLQQDYNRCESGPVTRVREMGIPFMCIIYMIEYFTFFIVYYYQSTSSLSTNLTVTVLKEIGIQDDTETH